MTENEMLKIAIHCLSVQSEQEVCEECDIYGNCHTDCKDVAVAAIKALEEIQQYRAIGAVEECREAVDKQKPKKIIIEPYCPTECPTCGHELSTSLGDGYYKYPTFLKRCPNCGQAIQWQENLEGMEYE